MLKQALLQGIALKFLFNIYKNNSNENSKKLHKIIQYITATVL
jgi:hypothetical protein